MGLISWIHPCGSEQLKIAAMSENLKSLWPFSVKPGSSHKCQKGKKKQQSL
jgi:hypothetical protein